MISPDQKFRLSWEDNTRGFRPLDFFNFNFNFKYRDRYWKYE
jgi:hypothetical protein